ncbi:energy transducer TonB [Rhodoblastus sp.]|uniref:energy transducer TonB n=1 Tax=Rhodoblastus sp. TaxID=1962975 RepID=UPI0026018B33|nr:energy transducer TonB [Rhodoblastus sp.]
MSQRVAVVSAVAGLHAMVLAGSLLIGSETIAPPAVLGVDVVSQGEMALETGSAPTPDSPVQTPPVPQPAAEAAQAPSPGAARDDRPKAPPAPPRDDSDNNLATALENPAPQKARARETPQPAPAAASQVGVEDRARAVSPSSRRRYAALVSAEINRRKYYPAAARGKGDGGVVEITFEIGPDGALVHAEISRSSGDALLDQAARKMAASAHFPPPPGGRFVGRIEISFRLRSKS